MKHSRGFTLIEIIVTLSVMMILMVVSVVALRSTQANGRDQERKTDAETIARGLEIRYTQGNPKAVQTSGWTNQGQYPGIYEMLHARGDNEAAQSFTPAQISGGYYANLLPGTTDSSTINSSFRTPGSTGISLDYWCTPTTLPGPGACMTESAAQKLIDIGNFTTTSKYTYSPLDNSNNICCCGNCTKFNLYYRTEIDQQLHTIKSKHQ